MSVTVRRRLSSTPAVTEPWIREARKKKETDPISSLREHDRGIKAILKFNGPCRFSSTCNLSQAARSVRWKEPVWSSTTATVFVTMLYCWRKHYNLQIVCVSYQSHTFKNSTLNHVRKEKHCCTDLCGWKGLSLWCSVVLYCTGSGHTGR